MYQAKIFLSFTLLTILFNYSECFIPTNTLVYGAKGETFKIMDLFSQKDRTTISHVEMSKKSIFEFIIESIELVDDYLKPSYTSKLVESLKKFEYYSDDSYDSIDSYIPGFDESLDQILDGNSETDKNPETKDNPTFHFDAEKFYQTNLRLIKQKEDIIKLLIETRYDESRKLIGQFFHTLQDFYSHSNWIEMGNKDINYDIGEKSFTIQTAEENTPTCIDCELGFCVVFELQSECSNKDTIIINGEKKKVETYEKNCEKNLIPAKKLTSGYYGGQILDGKSVNKPKNKCSHGGELDTTRKIRPYGGINKDSGIKEYSPHYLHHLDAVRLAVKATKNFLQTIRSNIGLLKSLCIFNILCQKEVLYIIDSTGSMQSHISNVKYLAKEIRTDLKKIYDTNYQLNSKNSVNNYHQNSSINLTIAYFDGLGILPLSKTTITNISTDFKFNGILSIIEAKQPDPIMKEKCIDLPFYPYIYCTYELDYSNLNYGKEPLNMIIISLMKRMKNNTDVYLFTDTTPKDTYLDNDALSILKSKNARFICAYCPNTDPYKINSFETYSKNTHGVYSTISVNRNREIYEKKEETYSYFIYNNFSLIENFYLDSYLNNITIDIETIGKYYINFNNSKEISDILSFSNNSKTYLKTGGYYLAFNISQKCKIDIYGINAFKIEFKFYDLVFDSSHPGLSFLKRQPYANEKLNILFRFNKTIPINLTRLYLVDYDTDAEISSYKFLFYPGGFNSKIMIPFKKFYFKIIGIDNQKKNFQRFLKQNPISPIYYSLRFVQDNVVKNKFFIKIKNDNNVPVNASLNLYFDDLQDLKYNLTPNSIYLEKNQTKEFNLEFSLSNITNKSFTLNILPIMILNNSNAQTIVFNKLKIDILFKDFQTTRSDFFKTTTKLTTERTTSSIKKVVTSKIISKQGKNNC